MLQPWETDFGKPDRIASALDIMIAAPLGCRRVQQRIRTARTPAAISARSSRQARSRAGRSIRGYHKPIMIAGGLGNVRRGRRGEEGGRGRRAAGRARRPVDADRPGRRRRLVGRQRPELFRFGFRLGAARQRRDPAARAGSDRSLLGAGRCESDLADSRCGRRRACRMPCPRRLRTASAAAASICARFRAPNPNCRRWRSGATRRRSAMCWRSCRAASALFAALCERERCPFAVVGEITGDGRLLVTDSLLAATPVDMPIEVLLGKPPRMTRDVRIVAKTARGALDRRRRRSRESLDRLLCLPTIADKSFLITIGDRTVGGMISRDQMVGPWQVPVADVAVTLEQLRGLRRRSHGHGRARAGGGARCAGLGTPGRGRGDHQHHGAPTFASSPTSACRRTGWRPAASRARTPSCTPRCARWAWNCAPRLGITIPVGKDSLSMRTAWRDAAGEHARCSRRCR